MMDAVTLLGYATCTPDEALRNRLPFPAADIDRAAIPAALRRRASQATQLAFSAATLACREAGCPPAELPAVFASVGGEIQVTDTLCIELAKPEGVISPTAFHNSVHNTTAAYWSIAHGCTRSSTALAAGRDTFAMALLECWCLLETGGGEILLVCYDEAWPEYLAAPLGAVPFAAALVLAAGRVAGGLAAIGRPQRGLAEKLPEALADLASTAPATLVLPLLSAVTAEETGRTVPLSAGEPSWNVHVEKP